MTTLDIPDPFKPKRQPRTNRLPTPESDGPTHLSALVLKRRMDLKVSQADLAERWGRTQPYVSQVEAGKLWNLSWMDIFALHQALEVDVGTICDHLRQTHAALCGHGVDAISDKIPDMDSGVVMVIGEAGSLEVRPVPPEAQGLSKAERVTAGVGKFANKDITGPQFKYGGVTSIPIHISDLPFVDEAGHEPSP